MILFRVLTPVLLLSSCAKMPELVAPRANQSVAVPEHYGRSGDEGLEVSSGLRKLFSGDSTLNHYISLTLVHNADLQLSAALLEEAGFNFKVAKADRFPGLDLSASARRSRGVLGASSFTATVYNMELSSSWEVDVWGRVRAGVQAVSYDAGAVAADYEAARESLVAETIQAYFSVVATHQLMEIAQNEYESLEATYRTTERRFETGVGSLAEVELAKSDLANADSAKEQAKNTYERSARVLSSLTGQAPALLACAEDFPTLRRGIPAGLPSELLRKRPDIQAAYLRVLAADERIKVAHKDLFPSFSLTGSLGLESTSLSELLSGNAWSLGSGIIAPLFNAGALRAELGASSARAKQALARYRSTVISALEEAENALGAEHYLRRQQEATSSALHSAQKAVGRIRTQYEAGLTDLPTLLETQRRVFNTEEALTNITLSRYQNRVNLALALGKGV